MTKNSILFIFLGVGVLFSCNSEDQKKDDQFFVKEETTSEEDVFKNIADSLDKYPDNIDLWIRQGEFCKEHLNFKCALNAGAKAYRIDSTNIEARQLYAWTLINKPDAPISDIERAKRHYQYVLSVQPNNPETMVNLANTFSLTGDFKTAIKYINDALRINERYRDGYVLKGSIYKTLEKNDLALSSYQTALQIDPDFFLGHLNTGWLLTSMEKHQLALEYYENAMELKPKNINAIYGVAKSLQDLGQYEAALVEYRKIEDIDPDFYITYFNQAYIKQHYQKELDSATFLYDKALEIHPKYVPAWYQLGETYYDREKYSNAAEAFAEALSLDPDYEPARKAAEKLRNATR